jgi:hypothetical protein
MQDYQFTPLKISSAELANNESWPQSFVHCCQQYSAFLIFQLARPMIDIVSAMQHEPDAGYKSFQH